MTRDEASRQSRSVKKRPASKPDYVPDHQRLDSEAAQLKDVTWMNTEVVLEDFLTMSAKLLQTLYKSKLLLKPSACPHCGSTGAMPQNAGSICCSSAPALFCTHWWS